MFGYIFRRLIGTRNERNLRRLGRKVAQINALEESLTPLSAEQLRAQTAKFRARLEQGEALDELLPEAFATVREAARRSLNMRHFDVQLIGGMVLHQGNIAEMATGEGKTLVATLPLYLNALSGKGAHLITVNDYLAERDANWMRPVFETLGMTVGTALSMQPQQERRQAYLADITYGTNNEFGFDYLRDNMVYSTEDRVLRKLHFGIVDEVDSILIDEARTPLIISGVAADSSELYRSVNGLIRHLRPVDEQGQGDFSVDEKQRQVDLTEAGHERAEQWLEKQRLLSAGESLYAADNLNLLNHVQTALRAHQLYHRDIEYIVQDGAVVLIDEHTGRTMANRRLSEGLHQALEAKEGLEIQSESQTLASTTFQNFFRLYDKLGGMTGTADTEAEEFHKIYGLEVIVIPTNKPVMREDNNDLIYLSAEDKFRAVVDDIREIVAAGGAVLVGTASIENSEIISRALNAAAIDHEVLNAKQHRREADIIAQAGRPGAVTIATNMAGRGTDIVLGGNVEAELSAAGELSTAQVQQLRTEWQQRHERVIAAGGLHVLGTERHESRRIDNQLRGRAGRQGDPGMSRFYLSLDDDLLRIFLSDRIKQFMQSMGLEPGEAIEHRMVTNAIAKAQQRVEGRNFDIRKQLLEYDDIADVQRKVVYSQRNELLEAENVADSIAEMRESVARELGGLRIPHRSLPEEWDLAGLETDIKNTFNQAPALSQWVDEDPELYEEALIERVVEQIHQNYELKYNRFEGIRQIEKIILLEVLDTLWKKHLSAMDYLRQGIHLRAYAQRNPRQEYKREAYELFQTMLNQISHDVVRVLSHFSIEQSEEVTASQQRRREAELARRQQNLEGTAAASKKRGNRRQLSGNRSQRRLQSRKTRRERSRRRLDSGR